MIPFVGGSYTLAVRRADVQRTVNMYPVEAEVEGSHAPSYLAQIPGLDVFSEVPALTGWNSDNEVGSWVFSEANYLATIDS